MFDYYSQCEHANHTANKPLPRFFRIFLNILRQFDFALHIRHCYHTVLLYHSFLGPANLGEGLALTNTNLMRVACFAADIAR